METGFLALWKEERTENAQFREDVRERLGTIETYIATETAAKRAAQEVHRDFAERSEKSKKHLFSVIGVLLTIIGLVLPLLLR